MTTEEKIAVFAYLCLAASGIAITYKTLTQPSITWPTTDEMLDAVGKQVNGTSLTPVPDEAPMAKPPSPPVTPGDASQN